MSTAQSKDASNSITPESYLEDLLSANPKLTPADINHCIPYAETFEEKDLLMKAYGILLSQKFREVVIRQNSQL